MFSITEETNEGENTQRKGRVRDTEIKTGLRKHKLALNATTVQKDGG